MGTESIDLVESLFRPAEVAELLGVPAATLANWRCAGKGPPFLKVGRHVRYRRGDVEAWIADRVTQPGTITAHG